MLRMRRRVLHYALLATAILTVTHLPAADFTASGPATVRIGLDRSVSRKFLLRASAPGGTASFLLDTGAPVSCAEVTKAALFKFQPQSQSIMMNGQHDKMSLIPQIDFGGLVVKNFPAVLVDLSAMNQSHQRNGDRTGDAILGLDALSRLHAVIDCGAGRLFLHTGPAPGEVPSGWRAIPMQLVARHLLVPVTLNGFQTFFMVDTGSPASIIDSALCSSQRIPVGDPGVSMKAIHHDLQAALGTIADLRIGSVGLGQTRVAVFDLNVLSGNIGGPPLPFTGLIGAQTLERLKAIIDCNSMRLYIKQPGRGGWFDF